MRFLGQSVSRPVSQSISQSVNRVSNASDNIYMLFPTAPGSVSQSAGQSVNHLVSQPIGFLTHPTMFICCSRLQGQSDSQSVNQSVSQSIAFLMYPTMNQSVIQSGFLCIRQCLYVAPDCIWVSQSIKHSISQSVNQSDF